MAGALCFGRAPVPVNDPCPRVDPGPAMPDPEAVLKLSTLLVESRRAGFGFGAFGGLKLLDGTRDSLGLG